MTSEEEAGCVTLTWEIENFGLFLSEEDGLLMSPAWKVDDALLGWLHAYHSCSRIKFDMFWMNGDPLIDRCEMSLISSCGEVPLKRDSHRTFSIERDAIHREERYAIHGEERYVIHGEERDAIHGEEGDAIHGEKRPSNPPNDTLTLSGGCVIVRMWGKTIMTRKSRIDSVLHSVNNLWRLTERSLASCGSKFIEKDDVLLYVSLNKKIENSSTRTVKISAVARLENCLTFVYCKLSIEGCRGRVINKNSDFPFPSWTFDIEIFSESNTGIKLQLQSIIALHKGCQDQLERKFSSKIDKHMNVSEAVSGTSDALIDDLLHLYKEGTFSDVTLNSEGRSFHAHRGILAARSSVFRTMFEKHEMSEGRSGVMDIKDVDSETLDRMLVFLYGGSIEDVQWEEAMALYHAAVTYAVRHLKEKCVEILTAGLTPDNVCDALVLANQKSDEQLITYVVDYIGKHREVVSSRNWMELKKKNIRLTSKFSK